MVGENFLDLQPYGLAAYDVEGAVGFELCGDGGVFACEAEFAEVCEYGFGLLRSGLGGSDLVPVGRAVVAFLGADSFGLFDCSL